MKTIQDISGSMVDVLSDKKELIYIGETTVKFVKGNTYLVWDFSVPSNTCIVFDLRENLLGDMKRNQFITPSEARILKLKEICKTKD